MLPSQKIIHFLNKSAGKNPLPPKFIRNTELSKTPEFKRILGALKNVSKSKEFLRRLRSSTNPETLLYSY